MCVYPVTILQLCSPTVLTSPRSTLRERVLRSYTYKNVKLMPKVLFYGAFRSVGGEPKFQTTLFRPLSRHDGTSELPSVISFEARVA